MPACAIRIVGCALAALAATLTACSSSGGQSASSSHSAAMSEHASSEHAMSEHAAAPAAMIGSECGMLPASGAGSLHEMAMQPLTTAAASDPLLAGFAAAVRQAGLAHQLDTARGITVFAPETKAFTHVPNAQMAMLHNSTELAKVIKYAVVSHPETPADFAHGMSLTTLAGTPVTTAKMGSVYEVGTAAIICGPIHTENATVYLTDKVLIPSH
jgi:uncharacterized surface protein with fasciclin (FAS1) repeats